MELVGILDSPISIINGDSIQFTISFDGKQSAIHTFTADGTYYFERFETYLLSSHEVKLLEVDFNLYTEGYDESGNVIRVSQSSWSGK